MILKTVFIFRKLEYFLAFLLKFRKNENNHGFLSISVNEKYIYALHSGEKYSQSIDGSNKIYVFDWDGNPIKELNLDRTVSIISVSPDNSKIIAYFDDGKANLISYKL